MFDFFYNFHGLNQTIFIFINKVTNSSIVPYILQALSCCFDITNFAIMYVIYCIYLYIQLKKIRDLNKKQERFWKVYNKMALIAITYTVFGFTFAALKFLVNLPRPFCSLPLGGFLTVANTTLERCLSSFPSSHTGLAFLVSYFIWPYLTLQQKIVAAFIIILVPLSRISLAMHYPADIVYSILVTIFVIFCGKVIYSIFVDNLIKLIGDVIIKWLTKPAD